MEVSANVSSRSIQVKTAFEQKLDDLEGAGTSLADNTAEIENELMKVRGDEIGNTLYSERWVLKTLIELSKVSEETWNESFEQDLCLFWDMTVEEDVVNFLHSNDIISLIFKVIKENSANNRLVEILVGILGNLCHVESVRNDLSEMENLCFYLISLLSEEDSLTLVQLLRLLNTCLWDAREDSDDERSTTDDTHQESNVESSKWVDYFNKDPDFVMKAIGFFMMSSTNEQLLMCTLELLETLFLIPKLKLPHSFSRYPEGVSGLVECLRQLLNNLDNGDLLSSNVQLSRACYSWENISKILISYPEGVANLVVSGDNLMKCLITLLSALSFHELTQEVELFLHVMCIIESIKISNINSSLMARLIRVYHEHHVADLSSEATPNNAEDESTLNEIRGKLVWFIKSSVISAKDKTDLVRELEASEVQYLLSILKKGEDEGDDNGFPTLKELLQNGLTFESSNS